jgi:hypothetical protein
MRVFNVRCDKSVANRLTEAVAAQVALQREWWDARRAELTARVREEKLTAAERGRLVAALEDEFDRLRAAGELRGTRTTYVLPALQHLLGERGWRDRPWKPVPAGTQPRRGRPWGTHDEHFAGRVTLYLPDEVGETLARACYWTSAPAVAKLQAWYDQHGDHWRGTLHNPEAKWVGSGPSPTDLADREKLIAKIHTTGAVLRTAIERALESPER